MHLGGACYHAEADLNRDGQITNSGTKGNDYSLAGTGTTTPLAPGEISRSDVHNIFGWNGAVFDAEGASNGLYLMRFRHYSPARLGGRWLQRDPAGYMDSMNLSSYVAGNPIGWSDPFGLNQVGQAGEFVGSDPVAFGSGIRAAMFSDFASEGLGDITQQDRMQQLLDEAMTALEPSGLPIRRMTRDEYEEMKRGEWWDTVQYWLDVAGQIPVVGEGFDFVNGVIYFVRGDVINASMSFTAMLPFAGNAVTGGRIIGRNADELLGLLPTAARSDVDPRQLRFSQKTASFQFHPEGDFSGWTIEDMVGALRNGNKSAADLPIEYVNIDGSLLIVNTRSFIALKQADIPIEQWRLVLSSDPTTIEEIRKRLARNKLTAEGIDAIRITGNGSGSSKLTE